MKELNWMVQRAKRVLTLACMVISMTFGSFLLPVVASLAAAQTSVAQCTEEDPPNVLRIDASSTAANPDGKSWACAYKNLDTAMIVARDPQSEITALWVAEGVYKPAVATNPNGDIRSRAFLLDDDLDGIAIYGGFPTGGGDGSFTARNPLIYKSILSGVLEELEDLPGKIENCPNLLTGGDCLTETSGIPGCLHGACCELVCDILPECCADEWDATCVAAAQSFPTECYGRPLSARHVVVAYEVGPSTILNGFTITGGFDDGGDAPEPPFTIPPLHGGAGMIIFSGQSAPSSPTIVNCTFIDNLSVIEGGAVDVHFQQGFGASPNFIDCKFLGNRAVGGGGGLNNNGGAVTLVNCLFSGNTADIDGGAIMNRDATAGFGTVTATNSTFSRNAADGNGGGVRNLDGITLTNCILWGNSDSGGTTEAAQVSSPGTETITYTCIQNLNIYADNNNIDDDPQFVDDDGADNVVGTEDDNLRLQWDSPSIDTANNTPIPADAFDVNDDSDTSEKTPDLDRKLRIAPPGGTADRGSFELRCYADCVTSATFMPPPDGTVDAADLAYLLGEWGSPSANTASCADTVTSATFAPPPDGNVDAADLAALLGSWGTPCLLPGEPAPESFMGGGGEPYEGTDVGDLLDQLLEENDPEAAAALIEELLSLLAE